MKMRLTSVLVLAFALAVCAPASASTIYTNGPITIVSPDPAWSFWGNPPFPYSNYTVSDTFLVPAGGATVTSFDAGIWALAPNTPATVTWEILTGGPTTGEGGTEVATGNATWSNGSYVVYGGYHIYTSTVSSLSVVLGAGTYWLELSNGYASGGNDIFWGVNKGPSEAFTTDPFSGGSIYSEAFTVFGNPAPVPVPPSALLLGSGLLGLAGWRRLR